MNGKLTKSGKNLGEKLCQNIFGTNKTSIIRNVLKNLDKFGRKVKLIQGSH